MKRTFNLSPWDNLDKPAFARRMTAKQAEQRDGWRYRVYCKGKLLDAFNRRTGWGLIWGKGSEIIRGKRWYKVSLVQHGDRMTRIYVIPVKPLHNSTP
jgi:hypothetical protein